LEEGSAEGKLSDITLELEGIDSDQISIKDADGNTVNFETDGNKIIIKNASGDELRDLQITVKSDEALGEYGTDWGITAEVTASADGYDDVTVNTGGTVAPDFDEGLGGSTESQGNPDASEESNNDLA